MKSVLALLLGLALVIAIEGCTGKPKFGVVGKWDGAFLGLGSPHAWTFRADGTYEDSALIGPSKKTGKFSRILETGTYHVQGLELEFNASSIVTTRYSAAGKVDAVKKEGPETSSMDIAWKDADHMSLTSPGTRNQPMRLTRRKTP